MMVYKVLSSLKLVSDRCKTATKHAIVIQWIFVRYRQRKQQERGHAKSSVIHIKTSPRRLVKTVFTFFQDFPLPTMSDNIRTSQTYPALVPSTNNLERILHDRDLLFLAMYIHKNPGRTGSIKQEPMHTLDQAFYSLDREGPPPSPTSQAASAPALVIPVVDSSLEVCNHS